MARKLAEWHPKHRPIIKIMLPNGVKGDSVPLALGLWCDFHEVGAHLKNVDYNASYFPGARLSDPHCVVMATDDYYEIGRMLHFVL